MHVKERTLFARIFVVSAALMYVSIECDIVLVRTSYLMCAIFSVPVAPQRPRIEYNATQMSPGQNVSAKSGERASLRCISRYGNPPAKLKWMLGKFCKVCVECLRPNASNYFHANEKAFCMFYSVFFSS
jgi:hypothetical protein